MKSADPESRPPSRNLHWFFLGFCGALLVILLISGILSVRFVRKMHAQELTLTQALAQRAEMLDGLWQSIQDYNEAVQQFVSKPPEGQSAPSPRQLDQLALQIDSYFKHYPVERDSSEALLLDGLRALFLQQRTVYIAVLDRSPEERRREAQALAKNLAPLQKQIVNWSSKLRTWNGERLQNVDRALATEFTATQAGLTRALVIGLGSGLLLALAGMVYIVRLERQTQSRYTQLGQSRLQLEQLSARLVDAQETERRSIARELHDEIGQALGALLVDLGRFSTALADDRPELKAQVESMKSTTERTFHAVRNISLLLRPSMLDDLGLVAALEWQGREVSRRSDIEVDVQSENVSEDLPDEYRVSVYRIVQEALSNAVRHSGAKNAKVTVRQSQDKITVQVSDDGRGFDPQRTRGLGLLGMEERVKRLGGTLSVESKPGPGVTVAAELPLRTS